MLGNFSILNNYFIFHEFLGYISHGKIENFGALYVPCEGRRLQGPLRLGGRLNHRTVAYEGIAKSQIKEILDVKVR